MKKYRIDTYIHSALAYIHLHKERALDAFFLVSCIIDIYTYRR